MNNHKSTPKSVTIPIKASDWMNLTLLAAECRMEIERHVKEVIEVYVANNRLRIAPNHVINVNCTQCQQPNVLRLDTVPNETWKCANCQKGLESEVINYGTIVAGTAPAQRPLPEYHHKYERNLKERRQADLDRARDEAIA